MPTLRFSRDKRGYETTALVHAGRRQGRSQQRILYWFRTPPGVKVGRPALDEAAIRWIEEHNPDIEFDWPKILEAKPPSTPPSDDVRQHRARRDKPPERRRPAAQQATPVAAPRPKPKAGLEVQDAPDVRQDAPDVRQDPPDVRQDPPNGEGAPVSEEELVEAFEQIADAEPGPGAPATPVAQVIGREDLTRLRARYAELLARIAERGGDAARIEALRAQADPLNPDTWVTEEDTRKGLAEFEPKLRGLRSALGLRPRRRSRRGGRRRSGVRPENAPAPGPEPEPDRGEG